MSGDLSSLIKPLVWCKPPLSVSLMRAETPFGTYRTWTHLEAEGQWFWSLTDVSGRIETSGDPTASEDDARAGAEADYQQRAALVLDPAELTRLRSENAEKDKLLASFVDEFGCTIEQYDKIGSDFTHKDGTEVFHVSAVLDRRELVDAARALLSRVSGGGK